MVGNDEIARRKAIALPVMAGGRAHDVEVDGVGAESEAMMLTCHRASRSLGVAARLACEGRLDLARDVLAGVTERLAREAKVGTVSPVDGANPVACR
jgi:hypothetical protein